MRLNRPRLALAAGTLQAVPFLDRLAPAKAAGFDAVSIFASDFEALVANGWTAEALRARIVDEGLALTEVEIVGNWLPGVRRKTGLAPWLLDLLERMTPGRLIEMAAALGADGITVGDLFDTDTELAEAAGIFANICAEATGAGLYVALEFIPSGRIANLADGWEVVRQAGSNNGGLLVDSWHFFRSGSSLDLLGSLPAGAIQSVQLSDAPALAEPDLDHAMVHARLLPGAGALDLAGFLEALAKTGMQAPVALEVFSDAFAGLSAGEIAEACARSVDALLQGHIR